MQWTVLPGAASRRSVSLTLVTLSAVLLLLLAALPAAVFAQQATCDDQWAAWSPAGDAIVFASTRTGDHEIFVQWLDEGRLQQITDVPGRDAHPSFSPDGRQIAFQSPRGDGHTNLYVVDVAGGVPRQVTSTRGFAGMPVWDPQGRRLAFQWRSEEPGARWQIMVATLGDGQVQAMTDGGANDQVVNWSPDGRRLSFHSDRMGRNQIYLLEDDEVTRVTNSPFDDRSATWSPDGDQLAFISRRDDGPGGVYVMSRDGSEIRRVGDVDVEHGVPFFSPDGRRLLITPTTETGTQVWTLDIRTGATERLSACGI